MDVITEMARETSATTVSWNRRYDPNGTGTDAPLKKALIAGGFAVSSFAGSLLHEPTRLFTNGGGPYRVFTPFWRALEAIGEPAAPIEAPETIRSPAQWPASEELEHWKLLPTRRTGIDVRRNLDAGRAGCDLGRALAAFQEIRNTT